MQFPVRWIGPVAARRWRFSQVVAVCCTLLLLVVVEKAWSANGVFVVAGTNNAIDESKQPFLLPAQPTEVIEAIADFKRFSGRAEWEKAFKQLAKVTAAAPKRLVAADDGVMLPTDVLVQRLLGGLPTAGKDAYRVFQDAEAKTVYEQAKGKDEVARLEKLASQYLITASGDVAADRLGDLYFESGRFNDAARSWKLVLDYRSDSSLSRAQLLTKIGVALARQGKLGELKEIEQTIADRHAADKATIGGKQVSAKDHLAALVAASSSSTVATAGQPLDVKLTDKTDVLWQLPLFTEAKGLSLRDRYGRTMTTDFVAPVAIDDARVYANFFGYDLAIDQRTGKLVWCSGKFYELPKKTGQSYGSALAEYFGMAVGADRVWSVMREPERINDQNPGFKLIGRNPVDGKEVFNSGKLASLKEWSMMGDPVCAGKRLYVAAIKANQRREVSILAIDAADGKLLWSTLIGSYKVDPSQNYYQARGSTPSLLLDAGTLYVDTHAGSFLQLDPIEGQIRWGLNYECDSPSTGNRFSYGQQPDPMMSGSTVMAGGVLYFKGMQSRRLYAIDPAGPKVLWKRPVNMLAVVVGADDKRVYLGGEEMIAYDLKSRELVWSFPVHYGTTWIRPILSPTSIFQLTSRGIYEFDKANGDVKRLYRVSDAGALGGKLFVTPNALIAVSNLAITAYRLESTAAESSGTAASAR